MIKQEGKVTFGRALKDFLKGYVDFKGRTTRSGFWKVALFLVMIVLLVIFFSGVYVSTIGTTEKTEGIGVTLVGLTLLGTILFFALVIPMLAMQIRRFRDAGMTGQGAVILTAIAMLTGATTGSVNYTSDGMSVINNSSDTIYSVISLVMLIICLLPTDELLTKSDSKIIKFFLREQVEVKGEEAEEGGSINEEQ